MCIKSDPVCFSQHTGGTANAVANVLDCVSRDPVLVEIRSGNNFYGHPFPSAVSIRAAICFMRKCVHSVLIFPGTVCVDRLTHFAHWSILSVQTGESICNYRVFSDIYPFYRHYLLLYHLSKQCRPLSDISFNVNLVYTLDLHCLSYSFIWVLGIIGLSDCVQIMSKCLFCLCVWFTYQSTIFESYRDIS